MKRAAAFAPILVLTACATSRPADHLRGEQQSATATEPASVAIEPATGATEPLQITAVDITSFPPDSVDCRRRAPTGSRIAVKECESTLPPTAMEEMARNRLLENVEEQRRQMWRLEQQRQQAALETAIGIGGAAGALSAPPQ